ncbi:MAG: RelA/SpoT domain-containing protein [Chloroflexi bacterium]|nr:RelA/SpoT domain-containing protein [Chloroflexota bacterium]
MSPLDSKTFAAQHNFSEEDLEKSGVSFTLLDDIINMHCAEEQELLLTGRSISERLGQLKEVHSLKVRVKDPGHLAAKIVRKRLEQPDDPEVTADSYSTRITDLVGVRALHLFKDDWRPIHDFVQRTWTLEEQPTAYVREGDSPVTTDAFTGAGCRVEKHPFGYRSVHYLISSQPTAKKRIVELQVRTLFEEAWSEIDHHIRYPRRSGDPHLAEFLTIFNRLAGSSDEMGTFIKTLSSHLSLQGATIVAARAEADQKEADLREAIAELKISDTEKAALRKQVEALRNSSAHGAFQSLVAAGSILSAAALNVSSLGEDSPFGDLASRLRATTLDSGILGNRTSLWSSVANLNQRTCTNCGKTFNVGSGPLTITVNTVCPDCQKGLLTLK